MIFLSKFFKGAITISLLAAVSTGCSTAPKTPEGVSATSLTPRISSNPKILAATNGLERTQLQLIATNLIATLVQIPEMRPATATLQISQPQTAYGHALVRAMEDYLVSMLLKVGQYFHLP